MDLRSVGPILVALLSATSVRAESESPRALARSLFQELIEINTTDSVGNVTTAAAAMAKRLRAAGCAWQAPQIGGESPNPGP